MKKKQKYSKIFNNIYEKLIPEELKPVANSPYTDMINEIAKNIQNADRSEALKGLNRLAEAYQGDVEKNKTVKSSMEIFKKIFENQIFVLFLVIISLVYFVFAVFFSFRHDFEKLLFLWHNMKKKK